MKRLVHILIQILNAIFIALTFALLFIAIFQKEWFELFIEWIKTFVNDWGNGNYVILFVSALLETFPVIGIIFPGQNILLIIGGFFAQISYWNLVWVIIVTSISAIIGNYIGYWMGTKWGKIFFEKYGMWFGIGETEIKYLEKGIEKWGAWGITLGKFHPLTRSFLPFIAGSAGMKSKKFMLYNAIGSIVWSIIMICFGVIFAQYYKIFLEYAGTISLVILASVALYIYFFKKKEFLQYIKEKNAELDRKYPQQK